MTRVLPLSLTLASLLALSSCGDDPVAHSETVSIKLSGLKNGDVDNGVYSEEKNINTESGNPYGEFLKNARAALGGKDPGAIELTSAFVRVHADSKNVATLEQVLADVELFVSDSATTLPVGQKDAPTGSSVAIPLDEELDYEPIAATLLGGDFKVGVRGTAVDPLPSDFELKLTLDLKFTAYE